LKPKRRLASKLLRLPLGVIDYTFHISDKPRYAHNVMRLYGRIFNVVITSVIGGYQDWKSMAPQVSTNELYSEW
jgi:hypothetical protein